MSMKYHQELHNLRHSWNAFIEKATANAAKPYRSKWLHFGEKNQTDCIVVCDTAKTTSTLNIDRSDLCFEKPSVSRHSNMSWLKNVRDLLALTKLPINPRIKKIQVIQILKWINYNRKKNSRDFELKIYCNIECIDFKRILEYGSK